MHANNVCHFAIHADDVERAKSFYQCVFGWRFEEWGPPDFYLIKTGNDESPGILGALQKRTEPLGTGFSGYECSISVEDIRKTEAIIVECGGAIHVKPVEIPTVGVLVKFADTEGNVACAIQYFSKI
jgi:predicted enzyme related to lactoylglutathione lyase